MLPGQFTNLPFLHMVTEVLEYALHAKGILIFYLALWCDCKFATSHSNSDFFCSVHKISLSFFFPPEIKMFILNCQITRSTNFISSINAEDISD